MTVCSLESVFYNTVQSRLWQSVVWSLYFTIHYSLDYDSLYSGVCILQYNTVSIMTVCSLESVFYNTVQSRLWQSVVWSLYFTIQYSLDYDSLYSGVCILQYNTVSIMTVCSLESVFYNTVQSRLWQSVFWSLYFTIQ
jgi:hypothetical protein